MVEDVKRHLSRIRSRARAPRPTNQGDYLLVRRQALIDEIDTASAQGQDVLLIVHDHQTWHRFEGLGVVTAETVVPILIELAAALRLLG